MATIFLDTGARSFSSKASTPSIHTISRPFSNGCSTLNRMRVRAAAVGEVTEATSPAPDTSPGEGSITAGGRRAAGRPVGRAAAAVAGDGGGGGATAGTFTVTGVTDGATGRAPGPR